MRGARGNEWAWHIDGVTGNEWAWHIRGVQGNKWAWHIRGVTEETSGRGHQRCDIGKCTQVTRCQQTPGGSWGKGPPGEVCANAKEVTGKTIATTSESPSHG